MLSRSSLLGFALLVQLGQACVTQGTLKESGYQSKHMPFTVSYADKSEKTLLAEPWYHPQKNGNLDFDKNPDLSIESVDFENKKKTTLRASAYDLLFKHRLSSGNITLASFPLMEDIAQRDLSILAREFANNLADQSTAVFGFRTLSMESFLNRLVSKPYVPHFLTELKSKIPEGERYELEFEVKLSGQEANSPSFKKGKMVLIRPSQKYSWSKEILVNSSKINSAVATTAYFPSLIVLSYVIDSSYYQENLAIFEEFIKRIQFNPGT